MLCLFLILPFTLQGNIYFKHLGKSDGLSQISVVSICQDELGRMWFGTLEGLSCYDGNRMNVYKPSRMDKGYMGGNEIHNLVSDKQGNLFFTSDGKLIRYDLYKEHFSQLRLQASTIYVQGHTVWAAAHDSVFKWNRKKEDFDFLYRLKSRKNISCLYADVNNSLWIGTFDGLYRVDNLRNPSPICIIPHANVYSLYRDTKGRMWVAANREGMYKIENGVSRKFVAEGDLELSNNDVRCFVEDDKGSIWVGTFNGLNKIDADGNVSCYKKDSKPGSLRHSSVFSLYKDLQGTIWVGTYYGGVHYFNPKVDIFRHYSEDAGRDDCLSFSYVGNMVEDKRGDVWVCTEGGGLNYLNRKTRRFVHYLTDITSHSEPFYNLKCIVYDEKHDCLYIGTHKQGFLCFDIPAKRVKYHSKEVGDSFAKITLEGGKLYLMSEKGMFVKEEGNETVRSLYPSMKETHVGGSDFLIDSRRYLWMSQRDKVVRINMDNPQEKHIYKYGEKGLGRFQVSKMVESKSGIVFLGTSGGGMYRFDGKKEIFQQCSAADVRYCYNMLVTPRGYLAVSNDRGLLIYHPQTKEMKIVAENQMHLSAINDGCGLLLCRDGEVFIGGAEGMSSFMSSSLFSSSPSYNLYFSSLTVNGKAVSFDTSVRTLEAALPFAHQVKLNYNENNISLSFTSNSYTNNSSKNIYEYRLEGFNKEWTTTYGNTIVYTNLNPGKYKLVVREKSLSSSDEVHSIELPIIIYSPWWATWWAYIVYISIMSVITWFIVMNWRTRMHLRASFAKEKMEKEKNEELTQAKLQFFANISHEFRTPLTLIISQIESLLQTNNLSPYMRTRLQKVYKNTFQFRGLISELLDFRKMECGKFNLHISRIDMIPFLKQICEDFKSQAQLQNIQFEFQADVESLMCWCDGRQLRKVFTNLLSNAFKHTPKLGKVGLQVEEKETVIEIKVIDSGEGIPQEALPFIFDRFYQVDTTISSPGSGIGLALAKNLVELHHGEISVKSALHYGSIFTVTLPKENSRKGDTNVTSADSKVTDEDYRYPAMVTGTERIVGDEEPAEEVLEDVADKSCLLLVEDNEELLHILTSLLSPLYRVVIAMDGKEGLDKAMEERPDLILSDIVMPVMSGVEMCSKIKNSFDLCHIPVVLLTALTSDNNKLKGLQCGADDYIEKPFNNKMLLGRIANILRNRKLIKKKYGESITSDQPVETEIQSLALNPIDSKFLAKLKDVVEAHLSDPDFDVNMLAKELAVSRSSLYNKLKALSCITPNEFILNIRLKHAADLLKNHPDLQITEIAYKAGFNSLRYFRHCFKACFNQTPQEYRGKK